MPGLVNDHFHVGLTPFQLGAPDLPLEMWSLARIGTRLIDPHLDQLYGAVQMIETGTTTVQAIHSPGRGYGPVSLEIADKVVGAYQASGMRVSYAPSVVDQNSMVAGPGGGEADFASQMPPDLAERYRSFMAPSYWPVAEIMPVLEEICGKYGSIAARNVISRMGKGEIRTDAGLREQVLEVLVSHRHLIPTARKGHYMMVVPHD